MISLAPTLAKRLPYYYGWVIVVVLGIAGFAGVAFGNGVLGALFIPMSESFGWPRTAIPGAILVGSALSSVIAPLAGRLTDRYGARMIVAGGVSFMAVCLLVLSQTKSLLMFYLAFGPGFAVLSGTSQVALSATTVKWFVRRRGLASAVSGAGGPLGFATLPMVAIWAAQHWSWRAGWIAVALVILLAALPSALLLLIDEPFAVGQRVDGERFDPALQAPVHTSGMRSASTEIQWTAREAVRTATLWMLLLANALRGFSQAGVQLHLVPHLMDRGLSPQAAVFQFTIGGLFMVVAGFFWGALADRIHTRYLYILGAVSLSIYILAILATRSFPMLIVVGLTQGAAIGATSMIQQVSYANYFGRMSAGTIQGVVVPFHMLASGAGGLLAGALFGVSGSYVLPFGCFIGLILLGAALMVVIPDPVKSPPRATSGR